ncbi:MAG: hypothetical protein A3C93_00625 [Candidatus Lloydbacteria bacterium RIFCSPHIGHO2_02_FULL_54_17]|uniref:Lipoprotein n=1 Tax=Candidatus Lloydbacteria bacterium RIFCSPHIGHO2_02_FULL_54_17 TaxID=1798664 RepID=A0A1G2DEZ7_9BACT|nr:MAG: hypothetical protein A2762_03540 [Candidatus Lloydbacteria bacterium RIFCSPHIGHO2_01_FULL_54_11]OGZ12146.1 MAG: hypothetical protein A3C93_00625 [Candidatus Lloydbacteria bacterium RIFCSPHIGHO2_02_FULL_54_17]OGZ12936.1 MAG: hypothetical protein A2948_01065 [Candidatus Lloydbacteria bacterium RIFCSPLOWO2_01_FULL_54_18]OGZ15936.1 MAG: hypothetical protein A3H76_02430 [Candidatus Lloydbacteria bacterium RIFCSPLOWO2_02_FULL_54_12]
MFRGFLIATALFAVFFLSTCTTINGGITEFDKDDPEYQSVAGMIQDPEFRQGNLPVRTLRVAVIANEWVGDDFVLATFRDASESFERQVGIRFEVTLFKGPKWETRSFAYIHGALREFRVEHPEYDLVFGVSLAYDNDERPCLFGSCYVGMIDDGRNIALLTLSPQIILHETGHAFLGIWHSPYGVMKPIPEGEYFSVANRRRILRNKWDDFRY